MNTTQKNVVIYNDEGVGPFGLYSLKSYFETRYNVTLANAAALLEGKVFEDCSLFVMPGGADRPYCQKLNGKGNQNIKTYVEQGGTYLGICAGAYYSVNNIEFHKGHSDEVCEPRELSFIEVTAYGSLPELKFYHEDSLNSAIWTSLCTGRNNYQSYYHGGCAFTENDNGMEVIARYYDHPDTPPAIISKKVGNGKVILSGVHLDTTPDSFMRYHKTHPPQKSETKSYNALIEIADKNQLPFITEHMWQYF